MGDAEAVRTTRSGDRFHYLWTSLRALRLLDWNSDLQALSVEGPADDDVVVGEEIIDVAEYFGGMDAASASKVVYHQLKHSSVRIDVAMTSSELSKTLRKFAAIYREAVDDGRGTQVRFNLVTNRILADKVRRTLDDLASGEPPAYAAEAAYIRNDLGFGANLAAEQAFCGQFTVEDGSAGVTDVERVLDDELKDFIPGGGTGGELAQLMHQVSGMATYEAETHTLKLHDLLVTLRTTQRDLFPAMPEFEALENVIRTRDIEIVVDALRSGADNKLLLTAHGGVGKSIFTGMLRNELAGNSLTLIFDCFSGGNYRRINTRRHPHRVALTQIANELASRGLCTVLIPSLTADPGLYVHALIGRVRQACERLALIDADALLTVVIDAADNAALAAEEYGERHFVSDLFQIDWPANFRLVALCRPERAKLLNLPSGVLKIPLVGFDRAETLAHLRTRFPEASVEQGAELHALSSGNPRVQAMAMEVADRAADAISALAIAQERPGEALDALLADQIDRVAAQGHLLPDELKRLCQTLATLHPTIPLADLAAISEVSIDAIRSFAVAVGRGLHFNNNTLQFRDEPTETWFRDNHSLNPVQMRELATRVAPLANDSTYVATVLPQMYFEARMVDELVQLALSDAGLPADADDLQSQEIARARARFALGAALRAKRNEDAALLAVKAGTLSSGHSRRMKMLRKNPDLAARFLDTEVVDTLCSGRDLTDEWPGSNLHVEAVMLSYLEDFQDLARTRYTSSFNTISAILRLKGEARRDLRAQIGLDEIAALALAATNIDGPVAGFEFLARWRPHDFVRETTAKFAARLADAGRVVELSELLVAGAARKHIQIGVVETMFDYGIVPSDEATAAVVAMLSERKMPFKHERGPYIYNSDARGVVWTLLHALRIGIIADAEALRVLGIHLEPLSSHAGERWSGLPPTSALMGHALRARLEGRDFSVEDVVKPEFAKMLSNNAAGGERDTRSFHANVPQLLPWASCLVDAVVDGPTEAVVQAFRALAATDLKKFRDYDMPFVRVNGISEFAARLLVFVPDEGVLAQFALWHLSSDEPLSRSRITVVRCAARNDKLASLGIAVANRGLDQTQKDRTDADLRVDDLTELARAILATSESEARAIFNVADQEAELVGDDLPARWYALTNTARALGTGGEAARAYRLLQVGETLDTDEHSDVSQLAKPLFAMHPASYCAAVSRQRDRRAISFERLLGPIFRSAAQPDGRTGSLALYAFGPRISWESVTSKLSARQAETADRIYAEYIRFERRAGDSPDDPETGRRWNPGGSKTKKPKVKKLVARYNFTAADAWDNCFKKVTWYSDERNKFVNRALTKVPAVLPDAINALAAANGTREQDFVTAAQLAAGQTSTAGLRAAVENLAEIFADRFTAHFSTRGYDRSELSAFAEASGVSVSTLMEMGFINLGDKAHTLKHEEYFSLASHIARTLPVEGAAKVFDALAELFNDLAPPGTAADGPFEQVPPAPPELAQGLAGLIWTALGDMASKKRWEAAHALLLLVQLGDAEALAQIAKFADGTHDATAFGDQRFQPYELHSKLWLLLALDRAASEPNSSMLEPFLPWLSSVVEGPPHAASQVLAQQVLRTLSSSGVIALELGDTDTLTRRLRAEWDELDWKQQGKRRDPFKADSKEDPDSGGYPYFLDFQPYWASHLGRVFATTEHAIARRALVVGAQLTGYKDDARDPRRIAGIFQQDSSQDHRSWPDEEDFTFYSAIHALLALGAQLAQTERTYKEPESADDEYTSWLNEYLPKRHDSRWLSDRRDRPPTPAPEWRLNKHTPDEWPWSLKLNDFETAAGHGTDWVTVSASYDAALGELSEDIAISSALVPNNVAHAYLIALQTNPNGRNAARLPTSDAYVESDAEFDRTPSPYRLTAWLNEEAHHEGIDRADELGRDLRFPPVRPGPNIINRFGLEPDADYRTWLLGGRIVLTSRVWDATEQHTRDRATGTKGEILEIDSQFLTEVLHELDQTLVLTVDIRRDTHIPSYRRKEDDDDVRWVDWSSKVYLIDPQGRWTEY